VTYVVVAAAYTRDAQTGLAIVLDDGVRSQCMSHMQFVHQGTHTLSRQMGHSSSTGRLLSSAV
jgi:hypothetical protein